MAESNADRVNAYFRMVGVQPRRRRPAIIDDDEDVTIGAARIVPENDFGDSETAVEFGNAQIEDDDEMIGAPEADVTMGDVTVERPMDTRSQGVRNVEAALPEFLSEPFSRATRDPESFVGSALRRGIDTEIVPRVPDGITSMLPDAVASRVRQVPRSIGDVADDRTLEAAQSFGERGLDALPLGFGEELYTGIRLGVDPQYTTPRQQERARTPGLEEQEPESDRARYLRERAERSTRNPVSSAAGTMAGTLPVGLMTPAATAPTVGGRILQAGRTNALVGAATGAGLSEADDMVGVARDAGIGGLAGGALGMGSQALGEIPRAVRTAWQARTNPAPILDTLEPVARRSAELTEGPQSADTVGRLLASTDEAAPEMPAGYRAGQFNDDVTRQPAPGEIVTPTRPARPWTDEDFITEPHDFNFAQERAAREAAAMRDVEGTAPRRLRPSAVIDDVTEVTPTLADEADVTMVDEPPLPDDADEMIGAIVDRPRRQPPRMPERGPALRAAALRGERTFGARGDAELDPSIQATRELSEMSREYADIEGGVGGFQTLKNARIRQAMQQEAPPAGWEDRSQEAIAAMASRLDAISRRAGAQGPIVSQVGRARFALDEAQTMLDAARMQGRPLEPAEVWRQLNQANMAVGRAAAQEARGFGSGVQHTSPFAEPLTQSYQQMRAYLADPDAWGTAAARVQREMNQSTAPLLRTGRALRSRVGQLFQDTGEQAANGGGFRTYEEARPEAVRGLISRAGDDAYESERQLLRAWVENYGEQGATLARIAEDPALAPQALAMQQRAQRVLDILDRAEVEGRAAQMLESVARLQPMGARGPSMGTMVRTLARIESGEISAPEMSAAMETLRALEATAGIGTRSGAATPAARHITNVAAGSALEEQRRMEPTGPSTPVDPYQGIAQYDDDDAGMPVGDDPYADVPGIVYDDEEEARRR